MFRCRGRRSNTCNSTGTETRGNEEGLLAKEASSGKYNPRKLKIGMEVLKKHLHK